MSPATRASRGRARLTARDCEVLAFLAEHRLARADHVARLLGVSLGAAQARLRALGKADYVGRLGVYQGEPDVHQISGRGLAAIGSALPPPRLDLRSYAHDIGVAWLWLAARDGLFGELREIIGERQLRSRDGPTRRSDPPLAVRLGGTGPRGGERLHYPDLLLVTADGRRIAVELELTGKTRTRREDILAGYGADPCIDAVLYLVRSRSVGDPVIASARRLGLSDLVHVQRVALTAGPAAQPAGRVLERSAHRQPGRGRGREGEFEL
ncbi:MAG TPA: hypothetical protein VE992_01640 [Solirubrobacteraceae bacterium]|nr:hypothetical protein [Solirubrobacteraceae bacterium]